MSDQTDHEKEMAVIAARGDAFMKSPFWFTLWDIGSKTLNVTFWLILWALVAQCSCDGCIWRAGS